MATLTKKQRSEAAKKGAKTKAKKAKAVESGDALPTPFDDLHTARDDQATPGHFVDVTAGPHKGRYGVLVEPADESNVVVRTRDSANERIVVAYKDVAPSRSGKR